MQLPSVGQRAEFDIRGTVASWTFTGVLQKQTDDHIGILRDSDRRFFTIPKSAVTAVRTAGAPAGDHTRPAVTSQPTIEQILQKIEAVTHSITESTEQGDSIDGVAALARNAQLLFDELLGEIVNRRYLTSIAALAELTELSLPTFVASSPVALKERRENYEESRKRCKRLLDRNRREVRLSQVQQGFYRAITAAELRQWTALCNRLEAHPSLIVSSRITLNLSTGGEFTLPLRVALENSEVPARGIRLILDQHRGIELMGNPPMINELRPGKSTSLQVRLMDRRRQGAKDDVRLTAHLEYLGLNDQLLRSTQHKFSIRLRRPAAFQSISNPFREFASGVPVDDPRMFFGRETLIDDILDQLAKRPTGRCFALYGQKRTGKSSVIEQVRGKLETTGALVASVSMGAVDRSSITASFVSEALDQLRVQVGSRLDKRTFSNLLTRWPDQSAIGLQPLASFRRACSAARALLRVNATDEPRVVIIVDEFTYLYELLRRDHVAATDQHQLRDFMRQWKSLLESKTFSALVVGQDTMPYFLRAFPNEFSVMHTERLDYLSSQETENLADSPIRRADGSSRFAGYGLARVHSYTGGHPYLTQILCDRIVATANENKRPEITEFEVDSAIETLLEGPTEIGFHRFDCLLSADNTGVIVSETTLGDLEEQGTGQVALRVVHRLARLSGPQNKAVEIEQLALTMTENRVLRDLILRAVVNEREGRVQIRVLLFAEYLRRSSS